MGNLINARQLKEAFLGAAHMLDAKKEWINELNVFPVPDGDTGTNMTMTIMAAARELTKLSEPDMAAVAKAISSGSLRGARGNSGVIVSQLIRGFTRELKEVETIDSMVFARAMNRACETAYRAVMKPKEGTILTVARGMADKALELSINVDDTLELLEAVIAHGDEVLAQTPELLPVLKEAGVVDSGGQGLMVLMKGALAALRGENTEAVSAFFAGEQCMPAASSMPASQAEQTGTAAQQAVFERRAELSTADIKFGYCTEFIINLEHELSEDEEEAFKTYLSSIGDSIVCVADEEVVKVHVHTNHPGLAFEKGLSYGSLSRMKVDNMREEHEERLIKDASKIVAREQGAVLLHSAPEATDSPVKTEVSFVAGADAALSETGAQPQPGVLVAAVQAEHKSHAFIAIAAGDGLAEIFRGIGVDAVIEGGQTMNPSTEDILRACEGLNAEHIYILPNNKNIILAANQARDLLEERHIHVIPSKTIPQGIAAMLAFAPDLNGEDNAAAMTDALSTVASAQVTYAVRNTNIEGHEIHEGDIMVLGDAGLLAVGRGIDGTVEAAVSRMLSETEAELVSLYYGSEVEAAQAEALCSALGERFAGVEFDLQYGGQPVYYYFISAE